MLTTPIIKVTYVLPCHGGLYWFGRLTRTVCIQKLLLIFPGWCINGITLCFLSPHPSPPSSPPPSLPLYTLTHTIHYTNIMYVCTHTLTHTHCCSYSQAVPFESDWGYEELVKATKIYIDMVWSHVTLTLWCRNAHPSALLSSIDVRWAFDVHVCILCII